MMKEPTAIIMLLIGLATCLCATPSRASLIDGLHDQPGALQTALNHAASDPDAYVPSMSLDGWPLPAALASLMRQVKDPGVMALNTRRAASWLITTSTEVRSSAMKPIAENSALSIAPVMENGPEEMSRAQVWDLFQLVLEQINSVTDKAAVRLPCAVLARDPGMRTESFFALSDCPRPPNAASDLIFADPARAMVMFAQAAATTRTGPNSPVSTSERVSEISSYLSLGARLAFLANRGTQADTSPHCAGAPPTSLRTLLLDNASATDVVAWLDDGSYTDPSTSAPYVACATQLNLSAPLAHVVALRPELAAEVIDAARALPRSARAELDLVIDGDARDHLGHTPMMMLARHDLWSLMTQLLERRSDLIGDINARDPAGQTVLHHAASAAPQELIMALLAAGADPLISDISGRTALHNLIGPPANASLGPDALLAVSDRLKDW